MCKYVAGTHTSDCLTELNRVEEIFLLIIWQQFTDCCHEMCCCCVHVLTGHEFKCQ